MTKKNKPIIKSITPIINPTPKKELIPLHYHPQAITESVKKFKDSADVEELKFLFEDIDTILTWAFKRLPLATPKKEENSNE